MEATLRSTQVLSRKQKILVYRGRTLLNMLQDSRLWIEKRGQLGEKLRKDKSRSGWQSYKWRIKREIRDQDEIRIAQIEAEAEEKKRADEIRFAQIEAAKEQAKLEAEKELKIKEMEIQAQQAQAQVTASSATTPPPRNKDAKSPKLPSFIDEKDKLEPYLLRFERYAENASWEKDTWGRMLKSCLFLNTV